MKRSQLAAVFLIMALSILSYAKAPSRERFMERTDLVNARSAPRSLASVVWERSHVKAIDRAGDVAPGSEGADILAFYFDERVDELAFRVSMLGMRDPGTGDDVYDRDKTKIVILLDYAEGGERSLPFGVSGEAGIAWDEAILLDPFEKNEGKRARDVYAAPDAGPETSPLRAFVDRRGEYLEGSVVRSPAYPRAAANDRTPIAFEILAVTDGTIADRLRADNGSLAGEAHCAFVHHGNQGLAYSDVFCGKVRRSRRQRFRRGAPGPRGDLDPGQLPSVRRRFRRRPSGTPTTATREISTDGSPRASRPAGPAWSASAYGAST